MSGSIPFPPRLRRGILAKLNLLPRAMSPNPANACTSPDLLLTNVATPLAADPSITPPRCHPDHANKVLRLRRDPTLLQAEYRRAAIVAAHRPVLPAWDTKSPHDKVPLFPAPAAGHRRSPTYSIRCDDDTHPPKGRLPTNQFAASVRIRAHHDKTPARAPGPPPSSGHVRCD